MHFKCSRLSYKQDKHWAGLYVETFVLGRKLIPFASICTCMSQNMCIFVVRQPPSLYLLFYKPSSILKLGGGDVGSWAFYNFNCTHFLMKVITLMYFFNIATTCQDTKGLINNLPVHHFQDWLLYRSSCSLELNQISQAL